MATVLTMPSPAPAPGGREVAALHDRAMDQIAFIRDTMERASSFTGVPGWGAVIVGGTALLAAWLAAAQPVPARWAAVWLAEGVLAVAIGGVALARKTHRHEGYVLTRPLRRFLLAYLPPIVAGALATVACARAGAFQVLPALWLLSYGAGLITGGGFSIAVVPAMGACFMALGALALATPAFGNYWMAVGFGGLHVVFGLIIARRHGG